MDSRVGETVGRALAPLRAGEGKVVLAVSGGVDSMVLLHAAAKVFPCDRLVVANFDHGTGAAARKAQALVAAAARGIGAVFVAGRSRSLATSEADWREARWAFLRSVAGGAVICTAHTADDQIETMLMRAMRGAGARGLAALAAESPDVLRPMLSVTRRDVESYASSHDVAWVEDPSNQSLRHLRNRVRHQILPALKRVAPGIDRELLSIGASAATWRRAVDLWVAAHVEIRARPAGIDVASIDLRGHTPDALPILWAAVAAKAGLRLDRRGAARLSEFTERGRAGSRIQLSGGWTVTRSHDWLELRRRQHVDRVATNQSQAEVVLRPVPLAATAASAWEPGVGCWRFTPGNAAASVVENAGAWAAWLEPGSSLTIRGWAPGDTVQVRASGPPRKVKVLLARAGITGELRRFWPVVLEGDRIAWIPGVCRSVECRSPAATERSGRPALPFVCAYVDR